MSCRSFSNYYFDKAVVMVQENFSKDIKYTNFKNSLEGCFDNLNLIYFGKGEKVIRKVCFLVFGDELMALRIFLDLGKLRNPSKGVPRELIRITHC